MVASVNFLSQHNLHSFDGELNRDRVIHLLDSGANTALMKYWRMSIDRKKTALLIGTSQKSHWVLKAV